MIIPLVSVSLRIHFRKRPFLLSEELDKESGAKQFVIDGRVENILYLSRCGNRKIAIASLLLQE